MRHARVKLPQPGLFHCISRIINREFLIDDVGKDKFVELMRKLEAFSGVDVLTFVVMTNHIHILLAENKPEKLSDDELLSRLREYYGKTSSTFLEHEAELNRLREGGHDGAANAFHERFQARMNDVSAFMGTLKQRFTQWYNKKNDRKGPLWCERFKSVVVEPDSNALRYMAAYIDLNPVRANLVDDPKDYRWSGYGEAVAGRPAARSGLIRLYEKDGTLATASGMQGPGGWENVAGRYRMLVYEQGGEKTNRWGGVVRPGFSMEEIWSVFGEDGTLPWYVLARCRVRYFTEGVMIGTQGFVDRNEKAVRNLLGLQRVRMAKRIHEWSDPRWHVFRRYWSEQLERPSPR